MNWEIGIDIYIDWASLVAQMVMNPPATRETWAQSLVGKIPWRRERLPTPIFWPREFHGLKIRRFGILEVSLLVSDG